MSLPFYLFQDEVAHIFMCQFCKQIPKQPRCCSKYRNVFCFTCLKDNHPKKDIQCPYKCGQQLRQLYKQEWKLYKSLKLKCPNCQTINDLSQHLQHIQKRLCGKWCWNKEVCGSKAQLQIKSEASSCSLECQLLNQIMKDRNKTFNLLEQMYFQHNRANIAAQSNLFGAYLKDIKLASVLRMNWSPEHASKSLCFAQNDPSIVTLNEDSKAYHTAMAFPVFTQGYHSWAVECIGDLAGLKLGVILGKLLSFSCSFTQQSSFIAYYTDGTILSKQNDREQTNYQGRLKPIQHSHQKEIIKFILDQKQAFLQIQVREEKIKVKKQSLQREAICAIASLRGKVSCRIFFNKKSEEQP